ncbi:Mitochondrial distribution and morphology protein 34 [Choanephora cucurbitarum]|uniref:Mitochondrial distribution and morphology protein 34 n=1 Tax=Choanephora cucurbitarum TaxID=101091 RepID=A0A1C7NNQ4_9FUNG|nr:Mitochondrial distribution and morphology protein 34 [Choanephora cucurbitarum]
MAFRFNWPEFDSSFCEEAKAQLETALNKGNKPKNIVDHILVTELNMGTIAPELEILEIGELSADTFRGIFKLTYCGDAYIVIQTKVQANPMHAKESDLPRHTRPNILAADQPLVVPMLLKISDLKLRGIVVLVVSKSKGTTLVFKNDPLESILVSSTFDDVISVRTFLQREIENQLRNLFQEDLPTMIHNLSLRYIQSEKEKEEKHEEWMRSLNNQKKSTARSVFSDPGLQRGYSAAKLASGANDDFDTFSMPELTPPPNYSLARTDGFLYEPSIQHYSSFGDLYSNCSHTPLSSSDGVPVTAANLSALNALYSSRFAALKTPYSEYQQQQQTRDKQKPFHEDDDVSSCPFEENASSINSMVAAELYADDIDAPWYITEGPSIDMNHHKALTTMEEDIVLDPKENSVAAKLAQLATVHHTISPFSHTFEHFTFRSLPHTNKVEPKTKLKKKPRRRIIRWNTTQ